MCCAVSFLGRGGERERRKEGSGETHVNRNTHIHKHMYIHMYIHMYTHTVFRSGE